MICANTATQFRLLDGYVGWDPQDGVPAGHVSGLYDDRGLRLYDEHEAEASSTILDPWMPPPWITPGCRSGEWFLISDSRRDVAPPRFSCETEFSLPIVLHRGSCDEEWRDIFENHSCGDSVGDAVAIAVRRQYMAVLFSCGETVRRRSEFVIRSLRDQRVVGCATLPVAFTPRDLAFSSWGELMVSVTVTKDSLAAFAQEHVVPVTSATPDSTHNDDQRQALLGFDLSGQLMSVIEFSTGAPVQRLITARDGSLWAGCGEPDGPYHLWRIIPEQWSTTCRNNESPPTTAGYARGCFEPRRFHAQQITDGTIDIPRVLESSLARTGLIGTSNYGFCVEQPASSGNPVTHCFMRDGGGTSRQVALPAPEPTQQRLGQLLTSPLDSFIPRCRWHRIRVDAEVPDDTAFAIAVATSEVPLQPVHPDPDGNPFPWDAFPKGSPHPLDWQEAPENATDFLIDQPAGRYLFVRIRLRGTVTATPLIRRVRIDFPRATSLDQLPAIYSEHVEAADFTERFLSLFDAAMQDLDRAIERLPALLDTESVPEEVLPWLGAFLGIVFHPSWTTEQRRALLQAAPDLYRQRGTRAGLLKAVELIFGVKPAIDESVFRTTSGAISVNARLGAVRLFGKSRARFRIGRSALGDAPLRSYGNPDHDPVREGAHRFRVQMPPCPNLTRLGVDHLERLIATQKPAHTVHTMRVGGAGFIVGRLSAVGVDTKLIPTAPPVLGGGRPPCHGPGNVVLSRNSILRPGPYGFSCGLRIGIASTVGIHTVLE